MSLTCGGGGRLSLLSGAGMALLDQSDAEIKTEKSMPLEGFLADRETAHNRE